jgi:hypothetical protein
MDPLKGQTDELLNGVGLVRLIQLPAPMDVVSRVERGGDLRVLHESTGQHDGGRDSSDALPPVCVADSRHHQKSWPRGRSSRPARSLSGPFISKTFLLARRAVVGPVQAFDQGQELQVSGEGSSVGPPGGTNRAGQATVFSLFDVHDDLHALSLGHLLFCRPRASP